MNHSKFWAPNRYAVAYVLCALYLAVGALLRLLLWWRFGRLADVAAMDLVWILPAGFANDFIQAAYMALPLALYSFFLPTRWFSNQWARMILAVGSILTLTSLLFISAAEYFFFEEFDARFNLVAFDYLMFPTEVIGDIRAEYPLGAVIGVSVVVATMACWLLRQRLFPAAQPRTEPTAATAWFKYRHGAPVLLHVLVVVFATLLIQTDSIALTFGGMRNRVATELADNGASSFFRAARTSEISYPAYYPTRDVRANYAHLREFLARQGGTFNSTDAANLNRHFTANPNGLGRMNVVVVVEEAFGAEFSKLYGSPLDLTSYFDKYAQQGIWFRNMYASGTRTVRGLEAISASFPPIPSVSILRRPNNEGIATWGSVMAKQGYQTSFVYGGYGYFDNMNYYFANNGFTVLDRTDIDKVRFENIWGVSDEDLFDRAMSYYDELSTTGQPFFSMLMTTSNHKPYTFREGVPGVPATGGGRAAGVRYADFALGHLFSEAQKHSWFDNTVFVVVADHGARVYGKAEIPLRTYEIPMLIYAPKHIRPQQVDTLTGQIDVAPTVLGLLGLEYDAPFFGADILACAKSPCADHRLALFSHNHDVAAFRDGKLAVLELGKREQTFSYDKATNTYSELPKDRDLADLSVAIYQTAYEQFQAHRYQ